MIKVHIFHTGSVIVDQAIPYKEKNPLAVTGFFRGAEKKLTLPVSAYLIQHPNGNVLIDTGWDSKYVTERPHRFFGLLDGISTPVIKPGESIDCKLKSLGLSPADIDYLFFSHMDFDHTSGLRLVQDARHIMASEEEIADSRKYFFRYVKTNWDFADVQPFRYTQTGLGPVGKSFDVFGDGSVVLINTPGHTHGMFSARISSGQRYLLLSGDTTYTQESIIQKRIPGFTVDKQLAKRSLDWICDCAQDTNCILIAANHDPQIQEQVITL
ncbi:MAG: N-acyl homoserine lactonase family protein [Faecousia sp.]